MSKRQYVEEMVEQLITGSSDPKATAKMIVERLSDEGLLSLGYGNADIDKVITTFAETFGTTKASKYDRFAANRIVLKYGAQAACGIIQLLGEKSQEKYCPVVNNVAELEKKWVSVLAFLRNQREEEVINV